MLIIFCSFFDQFYPLALRANPATVPGVKLVRLVKLVKLVKIVKLVKEVKLVKVKLS